MPKTEISMHRRTMHQILVALLPDALRNCPTCKGAACPEAFWLIDNEKYFIHKDDELNLDSIDVDAVAELLIDSLDAGSFPRFLAEYVGSLDKEKDAELIVNVTKEAAKGGDNPLTCSIPLMRLALKSSYEDQMYHAIYARIPQSRELLASLKEDKE